MDNDITTLAEVIRDTVYQCSLRELETLESQLKQILDELQDHMQYMKRESEE